MKRRTPRIAINIGSGLLPGLGLVLAGATLAADRLGWEVVGIRDGYFLTMLITVTLVRLIYRF